MAINAIGWGFFAMPSFTSKFLKLIILRKPCPVQHVGCSDEDNSQHIIHKIIYKIITKIIYKIETKISISFENKCI